MRLSGPPGADLVPLDERMRMISAVRALVVAIVLISWQLIPASRGVAFETSAVVGIAYLVTTLAVEWGWRKSGTRATMLFGIFAFTDALFIAWASY